MSQQQTREQRLMQVLLAPIISEKATMLADKRNQVAFRVRQDASKDEIKAAVEAFFKVQVTCVQVLNQKGKVKRTSRGVGHRNNVRKAYVSLAAGQELNFAQEGV
ncbi:MAG: 50S ribosomal protein L23 [Betaproteobacteria bacterium]|jgi:large subunit ribosomal protein L23|uniref:50S ribosomal protein L23 n=1 Tax=Thiomonas sp. FB-Cd TaxID=1158292 RepID=UPI0004DF0123|nr:50S ribosomal protein L23 [Thiomonas sp. FB-Cd]MBW4047512.1 50S ribosomal protein L23 [Pseudomonadota bacterium]MDE2255614.1 50S ribosomal protein L23 [Betaproteobacteria bacterium]